MESEILKQAISQGVWCVLFVWLLFNNKKDSKEREQKLEGIIEANQVIIKSLADKIEVVEQIRKDVAIIKQKIDLECRFKEDEE